MSVINSIKAIIILSVNGGRILTRYYDDQLRSTWIQFEKNLLAKMKTPKAKDEILVLNGMLVVHKVARDSHIYVVGEKNENPLLLDSVLNCLVDVITSPEFLNEDFRSRMILALDEICDSGVVLEIDPNLVIQRVVSTNGDDLESIAQRTARRFFGI